MSTTIQIIYIVLGVIISYKVFKIIDLYLNKIKLLYVIVDSKMLRLVRHMNNAQLDKQPTNSDRQRALQVIIESVIIQIIDESKQSNLELSDVVGRLNKLKNQEIGSNWSVVPNGIRLSTREWYYDFISKTQSNSPSKG